MNVAREDWLWRSWDAVQMVIYPVAFCLRKSERAAHLPRPGPKPWEPLRAAETSFEDTVPTVVFCSDGEWKGS